MPVKNLKIKWLLILLSLTILGGFLWSLRSQEKVLSEKVRKQTVVQRVTLSGQVIPLKKALISAYYTGFVKKIYVAVGDKVKMGDPIVSVVQSLTSLDEQVFPMRAPFNGTVMQVLKYEGEFVDKGSDFRGAIVRIDDTTRLFVSASTPEIEVPKLKINQKVIIKAPALFNQTFNGVIRSIALAADERPEWERSKIEFNIKTEVLDATPDLKPGMSTIIDIEAMKIEGVLALRHEFIQREKDTHYVNLINGKKVEVEIGLQTEDLVEIKSGLKEGDEVIKVDYLSLSQKNESN